MPNWKKVITSGSNAHLNQITASGNIKSSGTIAANSYTIGGEGFALYDAGTTTLSIAEDGNISDIQLGKDNVLTQQFKITGPTNVMGNITASGDISSSGAIKGGSLDINGGGSVSGDLVIGRHLSHDGDSDTQITFETNTISFKAGNTTHMGFTQAGGTQILTNITASGQISSSNAIIATGFVADDAIGLHFKGDSVRVNIDTTADNLRIQGGGLNAAGDITASGNLKVDGTYDGHITASGKITVPSAFNGGRIGFNGTDSTDNYILYTNFNSADEMEMKSGHIDINATTKITLANDTNVSGHITASGKISASSTIEGTAFKAHDAGGYVFASGKRLKFSNSVIEADTDFKANGNITASGNISASGTILTNDLQITGSGNLYGSSSYLNIVNDGTAPSELRLNCEANSHYIGIRGPVHSGASSYVLKLPNSAPSDNQILKVNGSPSGGEVTLAWEADATSGGGGGDVVDDTSPQLGGDLDLNSNDITGTGNVTIVGNISASGNANVNQITASAFQFAGSGTAELEVKGDITASGNISASGDILTSENITALGTITAEQITSTDDLAVTDQITAAGLELEGSTATTKLTINNTGISSIDTLIALEKSSATNWVLGADGGDNHFKINASSILSAVPDFKLDSSGNGSFTGNVSASGTMTMLTASIGGGIFTSASLAAGGGGSSFSFTGNQFATDLKVGRDSDNHIDFTTDNQIDFLVDNETAFTLKNTSDSGSIAVSGSVKIQPQEAIPAVSESRLYNVTSENGTYVDDLHFGTAGLTPAYAFVTLDDDSTDTGAEIAFGVGSAVTSTTYNMEVSHSTSGNGVHIKPQLSGVYKITGNLSIDDSSGGVATYDINVDGSTVYTTGYNTHRSVDPVNRTVIYMGQINSGSTVGLTVDGVSLHMDAGSAFMAERLS